MSSPSRIGASFDGYFPILGIRVPLRPGLWTVLAEIRKLDGSISVIDAFLGRLEGGELIEATRIWSSINVSDKREVYGQLRFFDNELYRVIDENKESGSQSTWLIQNIITSPWRNFHDKTTGLLQIESSAAQELYRSRINFPVEFLIVQFARREPAKLLQVTYYLNPESTGIGLSACDLPSWRESDFAPLRIRRHPDKFAYFRQVVEWAEAWWPHIKLCFLDFHPEGF